MVSLRSSHTVSRLTFSRFAPFSCAFARGSLLARRFLALTSLRATSFTLQQAQLLFQFRRNLICLPLAPVGRSLLNSGAPHIVPLSLHSVVLTHIAFCSLRSAPLQYGFKKLLHALALPLVARFISLTVVRYNRSTLF